MDDLAADFRRDGACVVRGLLDAGEVERLAAAVDAHMADPGPMAIEGGGDASSGRFFGTSATGSGSTATRRSSAARGSARSRRR